MSSLQMAAAESSAVSAHQVETSYRKVWDGGAIAEVKIPKRVGVGVYDLAEAPIPFLQFARNTVGGVVNMFVHTNDQTIAGKTIAAQVSVWQKTLPDGREFLHVDLKPMPRSTKITHKLAIMPREPELLGGDDWIVFETPRPLHGTIILAPPDAKMV